MSQANTLSFVPTVFAGVGEETAFVEAGRVWDCCHWQPGSVRATPTQPEVEAACEAVARLHGLWASQIEVGLCPGIHNRLRIISETEPLLLAGPDALPTVSFSLDPLLRRALKISASLAPRAKSALHPWAQKRFRLQPCVRDLRAEHVLLENATVVGIIDFGAMGIDHPAVDLARLLDDFAGDDERLFQVGLASYRRMREDFADSDDFVHLLAVSGAVCSVLGWLVRLIVRREPILDQSAILVRVSQRIARIERISHI